jgi:hypothetical protein
MGDPLERKLQLRNPGLNRETDSIQLVRTLQQKGMRKVSQRGEGEGMMSVYQKEASKLIHWVDRLNEPYRQNALEWLRSCTNTKLEDPPKELERYLMEMNPIVRGWFLQHTRRILKNAVHHFGIEQETNLSVVANQHSK